MYEFRYYVEMERKTFGTAQTIWNTGIDNSQWRDNITRKKWINVTKSSKRKYN